MRALLVVLVTALVVASASAGCFGKDKKKDDGTGTTTTTTNTTATPPPAPNLPPVPVILVNGTAPPANGSIVLAVPPNANFSVGLDGSGSTDPDGNITNFAWIVTGPGGFKATWTNQTFDLAFKLFSNFGKFEVTLRALDDGNALASANTTFYVNYVNSFDSVPIPGPGTGDNADPNDAEYGCVSPPVCTGTFSKHQATVKANATAFEVDITFKETAAGATLTLRVFDPSQDIEGDANALMQENIASTGGTFTASDISKFSSVGTYTVRLDVDGAGVESYDLTVRVKYEPQAA